MEQSVLTIFMQNLSYAILHSLWQGAILYAILYCTLKIFKSFNSNIRYILAYSSSLLLLAGFFRNLFVQYNTVSDSVMLRNTVMPSNPGLEHTHAVTALSNPIALNGWVQYLEPLFPWMSWFYIAGVVLLIMRLGINIYQVQRIKHYNAYPADGDIARIFEHLILLSNVRRKVELLISTHVTTPLVFGIVKPAILLPIATLNQLSTEQLEAILLHELAHIKRHDYLLNIFQMVAETMLFFNPFIWLISAIIRREREHCCDDLVLSQQVHPLPYARALALLETYRSQGNAIALAANGNKQHYLLNRIKRITTMKKRNNSYPQLIAAGILLTFLFASIAWFSPAVAQSKKEDKTKQTKQEKIVKKERITIIDDDGNVHTYDSFDELPAKDKEKISEAKSKTKVAVFYHKDSDNNSEAEETEIKEQSNEAGDLDVEELVKNAMKEAKMNRIDISIADADQAILLAEQTLKDIDWKQIQKEIEKSDATIAAADKTLKEIDWEEIEKNVNEQVKEAMKNVKNAKTIVIKNSGKSPSSSKVMRMHTGDTNFDEMLLKMEQDGLIMKEEGFTIKKENNRLYINGREQDNGVYSRYRKYLKGEKIKIKGDDHTLNVQVTN